MATGIQDVAGRQKILEGLWLIGIEPGQLNVDPNTDPNTFLNQLHANGVNDDFIRRAGTGVDWRAPDDKSPLSQKVADLLRASGYRTDEVERFLGEAQLVGNSPSKLLGVLTSQFNDRTAGAMMFKATGGKDVSGAVWNPYRTDLPPKNADVRYGSMGQPATQTITTSTGVGPAGTRVNQPAQLPTPPPPGTPGATGATAKRPAGEQTPSPAAGAPGAVSTPGGGGPNNQIAAPATWSDDQIKDFIKSNFGANAYFVDIPEVWEALKGVVRSGKGVNGLEPALETTNFWKQNTASARSWYVRERSDPAQAAADIAQQGQAIENIARTMGVTVDPTRIQEMAQSYLRYGWTQTDLQRAIGAEWHYDPNSKNQAAAVGKMKQDARNWLVPLSDQAIQTWGQGLMTGTTTEEQFQQYLRDNAKSLLPQLADLIDKHQGDPNFTVDHFVDPYRQTAASTLGIQPDQVDFSDPKWRKALDQVDPKTNTRRIMSLSEWQSTLKTDASYGYDRTANGIQDGVNLAQTLKASMGFGG